MTKKYRATIRNRQGACDPIGIVARSRREVVRRLRAEWCSVEDLHVSVCNEYGEIIGEKTFGRRNFSWLSRGANE